MHEQRKLLGYKYMKNWNMNLVSLWSFNFYVYTFQGIDLISHKKDTVIRKAPRDLPGHEERSSTESPPTTTTEVPTTNTSTFSPNSEPHKSKDMSALAPFPLLRYDWKKQSDRSSFEEKLNAFRSKRALWSTKKKMWWFFKIVMPQLLTVLALYATTAYVIVT